MPKVYVVGGSTGYAAPITDCQLVENIEDAQIVVFTGGGDINPKLYNEEAIPETQSPLESRDALEVEAFSKVRPDQIVYAVCRGAQLMCALHGGKLAQHVTNHAGGSHGMKGMDKVLSITSLHHQMMYPFDIDRTHYSILFVSERKQSAKYLGGGINPQKYLIHGEPEVILFHAPNKPVCLAVQGHPEFYPKSATSRFINQLLQSLLVPDAWKLYRKHTESGLLESEQNLTEEDYLGLEQIRKYVGDEHFEEQLREIDRLIEENQD